MLFEEWLLFCGKLQQILKFSFKFLEAFSKPAQTLNLPFFKFKIFGVLFGKGQKIGKSPKVAFRATEDKNILSLNVADMLLFWWSVNCHQMPNMYSAIIFGRNILWAFHSYVTWEQESWSNQLPPELEIYLIHLHLVFKVTTNYNKFHLYSVQRNEHIQMPASLHYLLSEKRMTSSELFNFWRSKLRPINISQRQ